MNQEIEIIPIPIKRCENLDFNRPLRKFITRQYGEDILAEFGDAIQELQEKRNQLRFLQDYTEETKELCADYATLMSYIPIHFPLTSGSERIKLTFSWYCALTRKKVSSGNPNFDVMAALFNAAAVATNAAYLEPRNTKDSCLAAAKHFIWASGVFFFIKEKYVPNMAEQVTPDFSDEVLQTLGEYCIASAQQCVMERAIKSKMKMELIRKICVECANMFRKVEKRMSTALCQAVFNWQIKDLVNFKARYYNALKSFIAGTDNHQRVVSGQSIDGCGIAIARLHEAQNLIKNVRKGSRKCKSSLDVLKRVVDKKKKEAEQDNRSIYHNRVPKQLEGLEGVTLAKRKDFAKINEIGSVEDPFKSLFPVHVMEAIQSYDEKVQLLLAQVFKKTRLTREQLRGELSSLGLPGSVMAQDGTVVGFPIDIHNKIAKIQSNGGVDKLRTLRITVKEMAEESFKESKSLVDKLDLEEREDLQMKQQYGTKWSRHTSSQLNNALRKQLGECSAKITAAARADQTIDGKIQQNERRFQPFALPQTELDKLMPRASPQEMGQTNQVAERLRQQVDDLEKYFQQEIVLQKQIHERKEAEDVKDEFLEAMNLDMKVDECYERFKLECQKLLGIGKQEEALMVEIRNQNQLFIQTKTRNQQPSGRAQAIQGMFFSINKYDEIMGNIGQGLNFYISMQDFIKKVRQRVDDFVYSREIEKKDMLDNIERVKKLEEQRSTQQQQQMNMPFHHQNQAPPRASNFQPNVFSYTQPMQFPGGQIQPQPQQQPPPQQQPQRPPQRPTTGPPTGRYYHPRRPQNTGVRRHYY